MDTSITGTSGSRQSTAAPPLLSTARGRLTLTLLCAVAFLDFVDASIVNIALPDIRGDLDFSVQQLQWVPSGYLVTYGGFMLLGGRLADLLGRRRVLVTGTVVIGLSSLAGGFAGNAEILIGARLTQGVGAALMLPAALSILTRHSRKGPNAIPRSVSGPAWAVSRPPSACFSVVCSPRARAGDGCCSSTRWHVLSCFPRSTR